MTSKPRPGVRPSSVVGRPPKSAGRPDPALVSDLMAANRILAMHGVLDGWGHVSVRHNRDPERFLLSRSLAPELITTKDILEFDLDNNPVNARGANLYSERFLHGEIYKTRPDVVAITHFHAPPVIPFGIVDVPLKPVYHRAAFIAQGVPIFDIKDAAGMTDLLIRNPMLGAALAKSIADKPAVLMRGHGATVVGPSLQRLVGRSIFLAMNATLQAQAMALAPGGQIKFLDPEEARLIEAREGYGLGRAWEAWKRKALGNRR